MRIAVWVRRANQYPHVEGVVRAAARRQHDVYVICGSDKPSRKVLATVDNLPYRVRDSAYRIAYDDKWPKLDAIVVPSALDVNLHHHDVVAAALQTTWSDLIHLNANDWDVVYGWSNRWQKHWSDARGVWSRWPDHCAFVSVGLPVAEHLLWTNAEYARVGLCGLPANQPFLLYYPFPFGAHSTAMRWWWYRASPSGDRATLKTVRQYADRYGLPLVIKTRAKSALPSYASDVADLVIGNQDPGEPTGFYLMAGAELLVHHVSSGAAEAVAAKLPAVNIVPCGWREYEQRGADFDPLGPKSLYHWPGLSEAWPQQWVRKRRLEPASIDPEAWRGYCDYFLGGTEFRSGAKIVSDLEARVAG